MNNRSALHHMEFLHSEDLSKGIRSILEGENLRIACAFWGAGADQIIKANATTTRLICDISMGATNSIVLERLTSRADVEFRVYDGLHAKVYLSSLGAVVGSANISNNGVGFGGADPVLAEAGCIMRSGTRGYKQAEEWFEGIWAQPRCRPVTPELITCAKKAWQLRRNAAFALPNVERRPLFECLRSEPGLFEGIKFFGAFGNVSDASNVASRDLAKEDRIFIRDDAEPFEAGATIDEDWPEYFVCISIEEGERTIGWHRMAINASFGGNVYALPVPENEVPLHLRRFKISGHQTDQAWEKIDTWLKHPNGGGLVSASDLRKVIE